MKAKKIFKILTFSMWAFAGNLFAEIPAYLHCQYQLVAEQKPAWIAIDLRNNEYVKNKKEYFQGKFSTEEGLIEKEELGGERSSLLLGALYLWQNHFLLNNFNFEILEGRCFDKIKKERGLQDDGAIDLRELRVSPNSWVSSILDSVFSTPGYPLSYRTSDQKILRVLAKDKYLPIDPSRVLGADEPILMGTLNGCKFPTLGDILKDMGQTDGEGETSSQDKCQQIYPSQLALILKTLNPNKNFSDACTNNGIGGTRTVEKCKKDIVKFLGIKRNGLSNEILIDLLSKYGLEISSTAHSLLQVNKNHEELLLFLQNLKGLKEQIKRDLPSETSETEESAKSKLPAKAYRITALLERPKSSQQIKDKELSQQILFLVDFWNTQSDQEKDEIEGAFLKFHSSPEFADIAKQLGHSKNSQYTLYLICSFILSDPTIQGQLIDFLFQPETVQNDDFLDMADFVDFLGSGSDQNEMLDQGSDNQSPTPFELRPLSRMERVEQSERSFNASMILAGLPSLTLVNHQRDMIYFNDMSYHVAKIFQWLLLKKIEFGDIKNFISAIIDPTRRKDFFAEESGFQAFAKKYLEEGSNYHHSYLNLLEFVDKYSIANWHFIPFYGETGTRSGDNIDKKRHKRSRLDLSGFIAYHRNRKLITTVLHGSIGGLKLYGDEGDWASNKEGYLTDFSGCPLRKEDKEFFNFRGHTHCGIMARSATFVPEMRESFEEALFRCGLAVEKSSASEKAMNIEAFKSWKLFVTGHSLGGASSYFAAEALSLYLMKNFGLVFNEHLKNRLLVYALSSPKISFGREFAEYFNSKFGTNNLLMHYTEGDIITAVPYTVGYHIGRMGIQTARETYNNEKNIYRIFNHEYQDNRYFVSWMKTSLIRAHFGSPLFFPKGNRKTSDGAMFSSPLVGDRLSEYIFRGNKILPIEENPQISHEFNNRDH